MPNDLAASPCLPGLGSTIVREFIDAESALADTMLTSYELCRCLMERSREILTLLLGQMLCSGTNGFQLGFERQIRRRLRSVARAMVFIELLSTLWWPSHFFLAQAPSCCSTSIVVSEYALLIFIPNRCLPFPLSAESLISARKAVMIKRELPAAIFAIMFCILEHTYQGNGYRETAASYVPTTLLACTSPGT